MLGFFSRDLVERTNCGSRSWLIFATALWLSACGGKANVGPELAAASSTEAQGELRKLEEKWEVGSDVARRGLRDELEKFLERFPFDPSVARARVMLGRIALLERRLGGAESVLRPVLDGKPGRTRDEALVILGAVENRRGNPERALELLSPLEGKLLTREARDQYSRERTVATMASRKWRLAVSSMVDWLSEVGMRNSETRQWIEGAVVDVPTIALSRLLRDWSKERVSSQKVGAREWLHRLIIMHVTREALKKKDPLLARELLDRSPPWLRASDQGDDLSLLAALAAQEAQVTGRSVGVVLGGGTEELRRRSIRVAAGLLRGLRQDERREIRFVAAEDRGSLESALGTLSGLGATILVAGVEERGAREAVRFAELRKVPVVTMGSPGADVKREFGFVFGVSWQAEQEAMKSALNANWAFVGLDDVKCGRTTARPTAVTLPIARWSSQEVSALGVFGSGLCLRKVLKQVRSSTWRPMIVSGLESSDQAQSRGVHYVATGEFPARNEHGSDQFSQREAASLRGKALSQRLPSDWFFLLGYDAARLIRSALLVLPENDVTKKEEVRARHRLAKEALRGARAKLFTSSASSFNEDQRVDRQLRVTEVGPKNAR